MIHVHDFHKTYREAAAVASWLALAAIGVMFVPLIAAAFRRFDVSLETPP